MSRPTLGFVGFVLVLAVAVHGCQSASEPAPGEVDQVRAALKVLGLQYGNYLVENQGEPPADEKMFHDFLSSHLSALEDYNVTSVDQLLRAGRDGEPIRVLTGTKIASPNSPDYFVAAYEATGVNGKRYVSDTRGGILELDDAAFSQLIPRD